MEANHPAWIRFSPSSVAVQAGSRLRWLTLLLHHTRHASEAKARKMHTAASSSDEPPEREREREDPRFWRVGRNVRGLFLGPWGCSFCDTRHEEWWVRAGWPELSDTGTRQGFFGFFYVFFLWRNFPTWRVFFFRKWKKKRNICDFYLWILFAIFRN